MSKGSPQDVFFDDITVKHYTGPLVQEQSYYPFGLQMAAISDKALKKNNTPYKYNDGSELEEELNYYSTFYRKYDAQIGRFTGIDMLSEQTAGVNPYHYGGNNPIVFNDPSGALSQIGLTNARHNAWSGDTYLFGGLDMDLSTSYVDFMEGESGGGAGGGGGSSGGGHRVSGGFEFPGSAAQQVFAALQASYNNAGEGGSWGFTVGTNKNGDVGFWQTSVTVEANSGITGNALVSGHFVNTGGDYEDPGPIKPVIFFDPNNPYNNVLIHAANVAELDGNVNVWSHSTRFNMEILDEGSRHYVSDPKSIAKAINKMLPTGVANKWQNGETAIIFHSCRLGSDVGPGIPGLGQRFSEVFPNAIVIASNTEIGVTASGREVGAEWRVFHRGEEVNLMKIFFPK